MCLIVISWITHPCSPPYLIHTHLWVRRIEGDRYGTSRSITLDIIHWRDLCPLSWAAAAAAEDDESMVLAVLVAKQFAINSVYDIHWINNFTNGWPFPIHSCFIWWWMAVIRYPPNRPTDHPTHHGQSKGCWTNLYYYYPRRVVVVPSAHPTHWKKRQWRSWWSRWRISLTIFPCNRYSIVSFDDDDPARAEDEENEQWQEKCGIVKTWIDWWLGLTDWTRRDNLWASEIAGQMRLCHVEGNPQFHWILLLFLNN